LPSFSRKKDMKKYAYKSARLQAGSVRKVCLSAWIAACLAAPGMLLATPAFSASFDCSKGGSANEKIICTDPQLSAMDDQLAKTFKQARKKADDRRAFNVASDKQWRWREKNCSTRECLVDWYRLRQSELEAALADPASAAVSDKPATPAVAATSTKAATPEAKPAPAKAVKTVAPEVPTPPKPAIVAKPDPDSAAQRAARLAPVVAAAEAARPAATATTAKPKSMLHLQLTSAQIAGIAPEGAAPRAHYLSAKKGEYLYADPDAGDANATVSVHYLGVEHGQHILEAKRKDVYIRYTCSADCAMIGQLQLPGDAETDMVFIKNDHKSLPSQIVTDALNGLLLESVVVR